MLIAGIEVTSKTVRKLTAVEKAAIYAEMAPKVESDEIDILSDFEACAIFEACESYADGKEAVHSTDMHQQWASKQRSYNPSKF